MASTVFTEVVSKNAIWPKAPGELISQYYFKALKYILSIEMILYLLYNDWLKSIRYCREQINPALKKFPSVFGAPYHTIFIFMRYCMGKEEWI